MKTVSRLFFAVLVLLTLGGCAVGLDKNAKAVDWTKGSIVMMSVEMDNQFKPSFQPTALGVVMRKQSGTDPRDHIPAFSTTKMSTTSKAFLVTQQVQPGKYTVSKIYGFAQNFLIRGGIDFSVDAPFEVMPNTVTYLGRVASINQERSNKDDQSTGGVIPLIDQAVAGFGIGTLAVNLQDNYDEDVGLLKKEYVYLQNQEVTRSPLKKMMLERTTGSKAPMIEVSFKPVISSSGVAASTPTPALSAETK